MPLRITDRSPPANSLRTLVRPAAMASRMSRSMAVRLARASKQPRLPQPHFGPPMCMIMWPISPADSRSPRQSLPCCTKPLPMPVPTQMYRALRALRAEPSQVSPRVPKLPSLPMTIGAWKRAFQQRPMATPVKLHVRRHDHDAAIGIDDAGHGDADGRQIGGGDAALADHVVHDLFDGGHDSFRAALAAAWGIFRGR